MMIDKFPLLLKDSIMFLVGSILILNLHAGIGMVALLALPLFVYAVKRFHARIKDLNGDWKERLARYSGFLERHIQAIEKIKANNREAQTTDQIKKRMADILKTRIDCGMTTTLGTICATTISGAVPIAVLWYGVSEIIGGSLSLGSFVAISAFLAYLFGPARRFSEMGYSFSSALAGLERVYRLFQEKQEATEGQPSSSLDSIEFQKVSFAFRGTEDILRDLSFSIGKGEKVALVGHNDRGKSTIAKMLLKFYQPRCGTIKISGLDIRGVETRSLRDKIAYIPQRTMILEEDWTLLSDKGDQGLNPLFKLNESLAAERASERCLSGGESQKIEILLAIKKNAELVIVDEGSANLDVQAERTFVERLLDIPQQTVIYIAHRLHTLPAFDRIIVLDDGRVAAQGNHRQLLNQSGLYQQFWNRQSPPGKHSREDVLPLTAACIPH